LQLQDAYNNPVLNSTVSVSVSAIAGSVTGISGGVAQNTLGDSIIEFPDLAISGVSSSAQLRFTAVSSTGVNAKTYSSTNFRITAGDPYQLSVSATAISVANRTSLSTFSVKVLDRTGNLVSNSAAQVVATLAGASLSGTANVFASSGVSTFSTLAVSGTAGTYNLGLSSTGLVGATVSITITHGTASYITINTSATAKNAQALSAQPVVKIYDEDGNLVTTGAQSTQTVQLSVTPGAITGTTAISASGGIATFSGIALEGSTGSKTVTARIYSPQTASVIAVVDLGVGLATKLSIEAEAVGAVNGVALTTQPVLKLRDSSNNLVTDVAHNVVASINPAASLSGTTVAINTTTGTATFTALSISGVVGNYTISYSIEGASSSAVTSVSQAIVLTHGEAVALRVVSQPTSAVAGVTMSAVVVEVIDARGNRVTTGPNSNKTITNWGSYNNSSVIVGTKNVSLSAGVATFDDLSATTGANDNVRLGFSVSGINYNLTTAFIELAPNAPYKLTIESGSVASVKAGVAQANNFFIRLQDAYGNSTTQSSTISVVVAAVSASDDVTVQRTVGTYSINPGSNFVDIPKNGFYVQQVGDYKFRFSASGLLEAYTAQFTVTNAAADKLAILQNMPATVQSGITFSPVIRLQLQDQFSNPVLDSTVSVSVSAIAGNVIGIAGGVAGNTLGDSFLEFPDLAISGSSGSAQLRFTATSVGTAVNAKTYSTSTFQITSGDPYQLSVSATAISVANRTSLSTFSVKVLDRAGNLVANSAAQVTAVARKCCRRDSPRRAGACTPPHHPSDSAARASRSHR
jgi:hypothetical protein